MQHSNIGAASDAPAAPQQNERGGVNGGRRITMLRHVLSVTCQPQDNSKRASAASAGQAQRQNRRDTARQVKERKAAACKAVIADFGGGGRCWRHGGRLALSQRRS